MRNAEIGNKDFELDVLEEAYTSEHWIVRIYKVSMKMVCFQMWLNIFNNVYSFLRSKICPIEELAKHVILPGGLGTALCTKNAI